MVFKQLDTSIQKLQQQVKGTILTSNDADYQQARLGFNRATDQYPSVILIANDAQDIIAGVRFAREAGLGIVVQSTGHGIQQPANDNMMIVTSRMSGVEVDAQARTARVEAGVIWEQVVEKTAPYGLAPLLGSSPHVGVIGYTLGGGIGWLARHYGFAADSMRWIDIVTADGELRRASPTENSDLFWGLRGGGGNFGVVTAMEFDLYPVASLYGGSLVYGGELTAEALRFYRDWIKTVPEELTSSIGVMKFPAVPDLPKEMHGKVQVIVRAAYIGDPAEGEALMKPWLDWHTPLQNDVRELPFAEVGTISNDPTEPVAGYGSNETLNELPDEVIDIILKYVVAKDSPLMFTELRHAGGAISRVPSDANAISNRDAQLFMQMAGLVMTPEAYKAVKAHMHDYKAALKPYVRGGVYLNFMKGDESGERTKDGFLPENYQRLLSLKAKYDPDNMFRYSYQLVAPK